MKDSDTFYNSLQRYAARARRKARSLITPKIRGVKACDVQMLETETIFPEETFKLPEKLDIFEQRHHYFSGYTRDIHKFCVSSIRNGKCVVGTEEVFTSNNEVIIEHTSQETNPWLGADKRRLNKPYRINGSVANLSLSGLENNYFHWLTECLGRYYLLEQSKFKADFYILSNSLSFQKQYIELLGIDEKKILKIDAEVAIQADEIIVPTLISSWDNWKVVEFRGQQKCYQKQWLPSWIGNIYQEKIVQMNLEKVLKSKIYISRAFSNYRKVENEAEILDLIKSKGYGIHYLERMSVKDQIELFSNASVILGVHGSGFSNMYFCPKNTIVCECFPEYYHDPAFKILAHALGLRYHYIVGKTDNHGNIHPQQENVYLDLNKLEITLNILENLIQHSLS